jgi:PIN domain nuclease of toxin-antitoxin system
VALVDEPAPLGPESVDDGCSADADRLRPQSVAVEVAPAFSLKRLLAALRLELLPITPEIALLSRSALFQHVDPADRLIGATAPHLRAPLISANASLRALEGLEMVW